MTTHRASGFTLIELVTVVAIVAILATIALPAYQSQMRKSRRSEAIAALQDLQLRQERWRVDHALYATTSQLGTMPAASQYAIAVDDATLSATYYKLTATPQAGSSQASDSCGTLSLESNNNNIAKKANNAPNDSCW